MPETKFNVYFMMPNVPRPPMQMITLTERRPDGTAINLLNAVNRIIPSLEIHLTQQFIDEFGEMVIQDVAVKSKTVDIWYYSPEYSMFVGSGNLSNKQECFFIVRKAEEN